MVHLRGVHGPIRGCLLQQGLGLAAGVYRGHAGSADRHAAHLVVRYTQRFFGYRKQVVDAVLEYLHGAQAHIERPCRGMQPLEQISRQPRS